jgi:tRNA uridine 5-carboxymethylaminomethyl modification enzyme
MRLTERSYAIGLASDLRVQRLREKKASIEETMRRLKSERAGTETLAHILKRPTVAWKDLPESYHSVTPDVAAQVETEIKYSGYLEREFAQIEKVREAENHPIPDWINYDEIHGLKKEARLKLKSILPRTFGQAGRISGINPSDVALVRIWARRGPSGGAATAEPTTVAT